MSRPHLTPSNNKLFLVIRGRLRPLTKNGDDEQHAKYSPSSPFLPSVALGALLVTNSVVVLIDVIRGIGKIWKMRNIGSIVNLGRVCALRITDDSALPKLSKLLKLPKLPISALITRGKG